MLEVENQTFLLFLLHNLILLFKKTLEEILHTIFLWKFQTNESFRILHLIVHNRLTL